MRTRLILSPQAEAELDSLSDYIATDSLEAALRFYEAAQDAFQRLLSMPDLGASRELKGRSAALRMWPVPGFPNHLIFYRPTDAGVEIVRVLHSARDLPGILEQN